jgi:hypothetical protein
MKPAYTVGRTVRKSQEFPDGVPCIIWDGDSVLCEFPSAQYGLERASVVCEILNNTHENSKALSQYC